jgi:3-deoxy-manno-octulosonate cytidylyltransferase (CMP-KDO synthetase)
MSPDAAPQNRKLMTRDALAALCRDRRARGERVVFTNGCFDVLHAGHVQLLHEARALGDYLVVGLNSDASVRALKGPTRPVNDEQARAFVLAALSDVGAVCIFPENTPVALIEAVQPTVHVKGGDYQPDDLPEAATVRALGGEVHIVPLREGFSTTSTLQKLHDDQTPRDTENTTALVVIPARYGSTRFPGKPLALLNGKPVIEHVARAALQTSAQQPILVATDDERIAQAIAAAFPESDVRALMTGECETGTDRIAQVLREYSNEVPAGRLIVVNVQGDEPFINPRHIDALIGALRADSRLQMATLATPIRDAAQLNDPNVVKVVLAQNGDALYFSRLPIPLQRDAQDVPSTRHLRHVGVYAYSADWLLQMAQMPPTSLEETEKLEQLRALENGVRIRVLVVDDVVNIAIDTPQDLAAAHEFLQNS